MRAAGVPPPRHGAGPVLAVRQRGHGVHAEAAVRVQAAVPGAAVDEHLPAPHPLRRVSVCVYVKEREKRRAEVGGGGRDVKNGKPEARAFSVVKTENQKQLVVCTAEHKRQRWVFYGGRKRSTSY